MYQCPKTNNDKTDKEEKICNSDPVTLTNIKLKANQLPFVQLRWAPVSQGNSPK